MKTIIINRPKSIEKYYDETKFKIFIDDMLVTKLKRGVPVELTVDKDAIDIQAKVTYWGSRKERIELSDEVTEVDIARNPKFPYNNNPLIFLVVFLSSLLPILRFTGTWGPMLIAILAAAYLFYFIKYDILNRHNYILIKRR